jgi:hypothetical protein
MWCVERKSIGVGIEPPYPAWLAGASAINASDASKSQTKTARNKTPRIT